jgi:hypothetical protein
VDALRKPVQKALDFVIKTGLKLAGPIIRGIKGVSGKVKAKVAAGKAWVKGKAEAGKQWVKGKLSGGRSSATAGDGAGVKKLSPTKVKDEARNQLAPRLKGVSSVDDVRAALKLVMTNLRPQGLRRLHVVPTATEGLFEVHAEASPGEKVGTVVPPIRLNLQDIDVTSARNQFITVARGFIDGHDIGTGRNNTPVAAGTDPSTLEQQGRHAETVVLDKLFAMIMLEGYPTTGTHRLELYVTRTPCNDCTTRIDRVRRRFAAGGGHLDVVVRSLALYQGSRDRARNEATGRGTRAGGTYSLRRLQEMGVRVEVWDLERDAQRLFGPGVDPKQVAAVASRINAKVGQLKTVLDNIALIDIG